MIAYRPCRICLISQFQWRLSFREENFVLRQSETHEKQLEVLEQSRIPNYWSRRYGINSRSELLGINSLGVTKQLPQDLMHVYIEGIVAKAI